jgi:hypothetical protein
MSHYNGARADGAGDPLSESLELVGCDACRPQIREGLRELRQRDHELRQLDHELRELTDQTAALREEIAVLDAMAAEAAQYRLLGVEHLRDLPEPRWTVEEVVPEGDVVLFGQPSTYKTFVALDLALCVASGKDWHGHSVAQGTVVYVAAEGIRSMRQRIDAWEQVYGPADLSLIFFLGEAVNLLESEPDTMLHNSIVLAARGGDDAQLLVVDTLARSMVGGDENSAKDVGMFLHALSRLPARTRMVVHHTGKDGESARGSGALRGAADMMARIERRDGRSPRIDLACSKAPKDAKAWPTITLESRAVGDSLVLEPVPIFQASQQRHEELRERVLECVAEHEPVSRNKIERSVGGKATLVRQLIDQLVLEGALSESQDGQARRYRVPRPPAGDEVGTR